MVKYAQINIATRECVGVSFLSGEVQADYMISIYNMNIEAGDFYINGVWTRNTTIRLDTETVADITYEFVISNDGSIGEYVELSRITRNEHWDDPDGTFNLDKYKQVKIDSLSAICQSEILSDFTSNALGTIHTYGFDPIDQENIKGIGLSLALFPQLDSVDWKTRESIVLIPHTRDQFLQVIMDASIHQKTIQYKYLNLKYAIVQATDKSSVDAIVW